MSASKAQSEGITMSGCGLYSLTTTGAKHVIDAVSARTPDTPIRIEYTDQPHNDFNALIIYVYGLGLFETYFGLEVVFNFWATQSINRNLPSC